MNFIDRLVWPFHSLIMIWDPGHGDIPDTISGVVSSTKSSIAVGTFPEIDGSTLISIMTNRPNSDDAILVWVGSLSSDDRIEITDVYGESLISTPAGLGTVREVWVNDNFAPDHIWIIVDDLGLIQAATETLQKESFKSGWWLNLRKANW